MKTLRTARLKLRPFTLDDAPSLQRLAGAYEVALNTLLIPHPYPDGAAEQWISRHAEDFEQNRIHHFAVDDGELAGAMGLVMKGNGIAEIGYWIGVPFWGRGYATEAAAAVLRYGFEECGLHRIFAGHFSRNPASGKVLARIG
ncbi:MAG TPA: GNAT family N-acetyltransferase, partial [Thermoanaerobaculia bacterium]|nr:GNAT family N-acetyltransferase [Thermoanaerobaculia bacterium]